MSKQRLREKEQAIIRMRREGKSRQKIADTLGFTKDQIKDWVSRYNRRMKKQAAGIPALPTGRPRKDYALTEENKVEYAVFSEAIAVLLLLWYDADISGFNGDVIFVTAVCDPAMRDNAASERLSTKRLTDFAQVENLYKSRMKKDFARNELRPLSSLRRSWEKDAYDCYGLFDGDELLGYAFFVRLGRNCLFDYLAIAEGHRDEGLGSIFLRQLAACLSDADCVLGEVEDPDRATDADTRAQRERRLQFYLRSGYLKTDLTSRLFGVDYRILEVPTGAMHTTDELRTVYTELYKSILPGLFFRTQLKVF